MDKLALRLADARHTVRLIDPSDQEPHWTLLDARQSGWGHDEIMTWAKSRTRPGPKNDAAQHGTLAEGGSGSVLTPSAAAPPASEALGDTEVVAPPSIVQPGPPTLTVVDGNTLRAPKRAEIDPDQLPAFSEFALAQRFADGPGLDWRYTAAWNLWAKWAGHRWEPDERKGITWEVKDCCTAIMKEHLADSTPANRLKLGTLKTINAVMGIACADPRIATLANSWDADPMLLGTPSGIVDLRTGQIVQSERKQMISKSTSVSTIPGPHPWWDCVLERSHHGDQSLLAFIQRWCGYLLTGDTREERFLFIHGPGAGGKSKFLAPLADILGDYRRTAKIDSFTARDRSEHSEEIARLAGARLVTATETEEGSRWNESRITALTGRDAIAARHMHKSTFEFQPQFKLVFVGNHRPALRSVGEEMRRRIDLIEWGVTIPEAERVLDLPERLKAEYPAILTWMIEGCLAWQREGLGKPAAVETATRDYLSSEDTFGAWLEECVIADAESRCRSGAAYHAFRRWAEHAGEYVPSQKRFTQKLLDRGFQSRRTASERQFVGFRLKITDDAEGPPTSWLPD